MPRTQEELAEEIMNEPDETLDNLDLVNNTELNEEDDDADEDYEGSDVDEIDFDTGVEDYGGGSDGYW